MYVGARSGQGRSTGIIIITRAGEEEKSGQDESWSRRDEFSFPEIAERGKEKERGGERLASVPPKALSLSLFRRPGLRLPVSASERTEGRARSGSEHTKNEPAQPGDGLMSLENRRRRRGH